MTDDRKAGIALIAGSLGFILTMAIHPTAGSSLSDEQVVHLMRLSGVAHSLAIASMVALFLGACRLAQRLAAADRYAFAAIVVFGFACVAIFIAAAVSGFIVPAIMRRMVRDEAVNAHQWRVLVYGIFQINQAFARIYSVAASTAIVLWSVTSLRNGGLGRGVAIYGCIISALITMGVASGHVQLDVHGMAAIGFGQAIWFIAAGLQLYSSPASGVSPQSVPSVSGSLAR
jgi:hypothetical protein